MQSVLISIRPQWCELIASGKKTIEVRKTRPKLKTPFKAYIYQTKPKDRLITILKDGDENYGETYHGKPVFIKTYGDGYWTGRNQKVIGEFVCDKMYGIYYSIYPHDPPVFEELGTLNRPDLMAETCLSEIAINDYLDGETGYGWHISDLQIYDKPRGLSELYHYLPDKILNNGGRSPHGERGLKFTLLARGVKTAKVAPLTGSVD